MSERPKCIDPNIPFELLSSGWSADCFNLGKNVLKIRREKLPSNQALALCSTLTQQYNLIRDYLSPYVLPTDFFLADEPETDGFARICIFQPLITGYSLQEALSLAKNKSLSAEKIADFLAKSLKLFVETGLIPDLFGKLEYNFWQVYSPLTSPNLRIVEKDNTLTPCLVDTVFNRLTPNRLVGNTHNLLLARNIKRLHEELA